jgi:hypothetical protein
LTRWRSAVRARTGLPSITDSTQQQYVPRRSIGVTRHHWSPIAKGFRPPTVDELESVGCRPPKLWTSCCGRVGIVHLSENPHWFERSVAWVRLRVCQLSDGIPIFPGRKSSIFSRRGRWRNLPVASLVHRAQIQVQPVQDFLDELVAWDIMARVVDQVFLLVFL